MRLVCHDKTGLSSPSMFQELAGIGLMKLLTQNINRRSFITKTAAFAAVPTAASALLPIPASNEMHFKILRNGTPIGEQFMKFTQNGSSLQVETQADMVVRIAGIAVFHYHAEVLEHWVDGVFQRLDSQVNHNGTKLMVAANPIQDGFAIESTKAGDYQYTSKPKMLPMTYWNKAMLDSMILNVETGHHYPAVVNSPGWSWLPTAEGGTILAQQFDVTGHLHLTLWYEQSGQWAGLAFHVDGQEVFQKYVA